MSGAATDKYRETTRIYVCEKEAEALEQRGNGVKIQL